MKPSLEDERRALLEQIEASRTVYRRMLADEPLGATPTGRAAARSGAAGDTAGATSLGQRGMRWMFAHPLWVAGGVALLVLLAPRMMRRRRQAKARELTTPASTAAMPSGGSWRALLTVTALLLRDPARLRTAMQLSAQAWHWLQRRRRTGQRLP